MKFELYTLNAPRDHLSSKIDFHPILLKLHEDYKRNSEKKSFSFVFNGLNRDRIAELTIPLSNYKKITHLNLGHNILDITAMTQIIKTLKIIPTIEWIGLEGCIISDLHIEQLIKLSKEENYSIKNITFHFAKNRITNKGLIKALGEFNPSSIITMCYSNHTHNNYGGFVDFVENKAIQSSEATNKAEDLEYHSLLNEYQEISSDSNLMSTQVTSPETTSSSDSPIKKSSLILSKSGKAKSLPNEEVLTHTSKNSKIDKKL